MVYILTAFTSVARVASWTRACEFIDAVGAETFIQARRTIAFIYIWEKKREQFCVI